MANFNNNDKNPEEDDFHVEFEDEFTSSMKGLSYSGAITLPGGVYERDLKFSGSATIEDDIECASFKSSGMVHAKGNILVHEGLHSSGLFICDGSLHADEDVSFSSSAKIAKSVLVHGDLRASSSFQCANLNVEQDADFSSRTLITGDCIVGDLDASSLFECQGLLNAEGDVKLSSKARIGKDVVVNGDLRASSYFQTLGRLEVEGELRVSGNFIAANTVQVSGELSASGNFMAGDTVQIGQTANFSGKVEIGRNLLVDDKVEISGRAEIKGNIDAETVLIGVQDHGLKISINRQQSKIEGNITAKDRVHLRDTYVKGDIRAPTVVLEQNTNIDGAVYYSRNFSAHPQSKYGQVFQIPSDDI
jgi:cytoskeletal protein CcmA (bactofilin family)